MSHPHYPWLEPEEEHIESSPQWMLTFADMISLVLTFFVLLYAMSGVTTEKWQGITASLSQVLNPTQTEDHNGPSENLNVQRIQIDKLQTLEYMGSVLQHEIKQSKELASHVAIQQLGDRLVISLTDETNFAEDSVEPSTNTLIALDILGDILRQIGNQVEVYGNSRVQNTASAAYPTGWELSTARALVVAEHLRNRGYQYRIPAYGRADINFIGMRSIAESKQATLAHRIDIIIRDYRGRE